MKTKNGFAMTWMAAALLAAAARGGYPELPVDLLSAGDFVILAGNGISTVPASDITGDIGVSPAVTSTAITGFGSLPLDVTLAFSTSPQVHGKIYAFDYALPTPTKMVVATTDMLTVYTTAAGRTFPDTTNLGAASGPDMDIGGLTVYPGLHKWSTGVLISTDVTLDAQGDPDAVFIFQISGDLTIAGSMKVLLSGGAQAKNIFWQVAGGAGAVIDTYAHFEGIVMTAKAIVVRTGASFNGKLLAQTAVTLDQNNIMDANLIPPPEVQLEIISLHGTGTPSTGTYVNVIGSLLTNSITPVETMGGTQYVNTGWSMVGNGPESGLTNSMSMTHTNDAVLTWLWTTNYYLSLNALHGSITNAVPGWMPAGSAYDLFPLPAAGYVFDHWQVNGVNLGTVEPLTGIMDTAKDVIAVFRSATIDVPTQGQVVWSVDWVCDTCHWYYIGTLTIANNNAAEPFTVPIWFEVRSTPLYWLRNPTGYDNKTSSHYLDISAAVADKLLVTGNGDLFLDPGESVTITGIALMGDETPTGLVMAVLGAASSDAAEARRSVVGMAVDMSLPVPFAAAKVTVKGLPPGMKYDSDTRKITGVPTKAGAFSVVFSAVGVPTQTVMISVEVLPTWAQGAFNGYIEGGGLAAMTVTARGKVAGKLSLGGKSYAFKAASYATGGNAETGFLIDVDVRAGKVSLPLTLHVGPAAVVPVPQTKTLGVAVGQVDGMQVALYRDTWKEKDSSFTPPVGYYTATLPGNEEYGSGYLTFTVNQVGKVRVAGKLADSTRVSQSGTLILDEEGRMFMALYTAPKAYLGGSLSGLAEFAKSTDGPMIIRLRDAPSVWTSLNPKATEDYGMGFSRELGLIGGRYDNLGNLYDYYGNSPLSMSAESVALSSGIGSRINSEEGGVLDQDGVTLTVTADQSILPEDTTGLKFSLSRTTGIFKGSFKLPSNDPESQGPTKSSFEGVLTPERQDKSDGIEGRGYFLWTDKTAARTAARPYAVKWSCDMTIRSAAPSP